MNKLLIICGPTATGKTKLALQIAQQYHGELVSADSRQVYKGLDVLTGKDLPPNFESRNPASPAGRSNLDIRFRTKTYQLPIYTIDGVPVWMYDVVGSQEEFSVAHYQVLATSIINDIIKRGKLPIIVGGTGLYIRALTRPIQTISIPKNDAIRDKISSFSVQQLQEVLQQSDFIRWNSMNHSDRNNTRRLVRAIEVAHFNKTHKKTHVQIQFFDSLRIGLQTDMSILKDHIRARVIARIDTGALTEVDRFTVSSSQLPAVTALGVALVRQYLSQQISRQELIDRWAHEEYLYAKRQMIWFRKESDIHWVQIGDANTETFVDGLIRSWYNT